MPGITLTDSFLFTSAWALEHARSHFGLTIFLAHIAAFSTAAVAVSLKLPTLARGVLGIRGAGAGTGWRPTNEDLQRRGLIVQSTPDSTDIAGIFNRFTPIIGTFIQHAYRITTNRQRRNLVVHIVVVEVRYAAGSTIFLSLVVLLGVDTNLIAGSGVFAQIPRI